MRVKYFALAAAMLALGGMTSANADPLRIRLSYIVPVSNWATILFAKPELAHHLNKSYTFEAVHFQGTPELIQALATGELEIANMGFTTLPIAVLNAGMGDVRVIADELEDGVPGYYSDEYMVRADSPIKTVEDLKGHVLTINAFGSGTEVPLHAMLERHHLNEKTDVTVIEAPIPSAPAMLFDKKVDLIALPLPFSANPQVRAKTRTLFTQGDAMGVTELGVWVAREPFIEKNRAALTDFVEDALRAERWYFDPKNHEEAVKIAAAVTKTPADHWESWLFLKDGEKGDYFRAPDGRPNVASLQDSVEREAKLGVIKSSFDVKKYVDLSLVEAAAKRLK